MSGNGSEEDMDPEGSVGGQSILNQGGGESPSRIGSALEDRSGDESLSDAESNSSSDGDKAETKTKKKNAGDRIIRGLTNAGVLKLSQDQKKVHAGKVAAFRRNFYGIKPDAREYYRLRSALVNDERDKMLKKMKSSKDVEKTVLNLVRT